MKEPSVTSQVFDMTGGLIPAPADDGYNIALAAYTPTGPLGKHKVLSQKEFIDKYMVGSSVRADDHMSVLFAYLLLASNPLYVIRAVPNTILEGISSLGHSLLFDKSFNLLKEYFKFKITSIKDELPYYYIQIGNYVYTTGDNSSIPSDEISGATKVSISTTKSIDALINGLPVVVDANDPTADVIKSYDSAITSRDKIVKFSSNIGKAIEVARSEIYARCSSSNTKVSRSVEELDYIASQGISYYFQGLNIRPPTSLLNPIPITSPDNKAMMVNNYFMLKCIAAANADAYGKLEIELKDVFSGQNKDATFQSSNDPNLVVSSGKIKVVGSKPLTVGTVGSHALTFKGTVATKSALPTGAAGAQVGDRYIVTADETHSGRKYYYTIATVGTPVEGVTPITSWDAGNQYIEVSAPSINVSINSVVYTLVAAADVSADPTIVPVIKTDTNTYDFLVAAIDYIISHWPQYYDSSNSNSLKTTGNLTFLSYAANGSLDSNYYNVAVDTEDDYTYYYYLSSDADNDLYIHFKFLWMVVGNYFYYSGTLPTGFSIPSNKTVVKMTGDAVSREGFVSLLFTNLYLTQKIGMFNSNFVATAELALDADPDMIEYSSSMVSQSTVEQFAIVQMFPSTEAVFKFDYKKDSENEDIIDLHLNYKDGTIVEDWTMSFVPGVVNGYGVDQWYTRVKSDNFKVVNLMPEGEVGDMDDSYSSPAFGNKVSVPEYSDQFMIDAMSELPDYEDGVYYDMISDSGVCSPTYAASLETLAAKLFAIYPASLPPDTTNPDDLISFTGAANLKSCNTRMLAAGDRESVAGFSKVMPGSLKIIRGILGLYRNKAIEFAPHFEINNGTVGVANLVQEFKKTDRERLLDYKIATLKGGVNGPYYINDNTTAQPNKSYMSEDQNVRMTNTAVHLLDDYVKYFKAELNTAATRQKCQDGANSRLQDRLFKGKVYSPAQYKAVCDDTNNPLPVINNNQLVVDLYASFTPSIHYILVNHYIIPLDQVK